MVLIPIESSAPASTVETAVELLNRGLTIVTDTRRLKHLIDDAYNLSARNAGRTSWQTPPVFTWDVWMRSLWVNYENHAQKESPLLLYPSQTKQLWENVIGRDVRQNYEEEFEYLLWNISSTASKAKSAYQILCNYQISKDEFKDWMSEDARHFVGWLNRYEAILKENHWLDSESLPQKMTLMPDSANLTAGLKIALVGFSEWSPQQQSFLEWLEENGAAVQRLEHSIKDDCSRGPSFEFENLDQELETCARWARAAIETNPDAHQVGVVIPGIAEMQVRVRRVFSSILNPDSLLEDRQPGQLSFHVTVGSPLTHTPLVVDAYNLLQLTRPRIDTAVMQDIIASDRIKGWSVEWEDRFRLADALVSVGGGNVSIDNVVELAKREQQIQCPRLIRLLKSADQERKGAPKTAEFSFWGRYFVDWLARFTETAGHRGSLGSNELNAHRAWMSAIDGLAELGLVSGRVSSEFALSKLTRSAGEQNIQPQAARVPIQIGEDVSMLGQSFTHLWILNMNNETWPGSANPNPFIPRSIQKQHKVPNSSPELFKKSVDYRMNMLLSSSRNVVRSCAKSDGGNSYQPSPMLGHPQEYQHDADSDLSRYKDFQTVIAEERNQCELFADWKVRAVEDLQSLRSVRAILKNQSNCPFRAFAEHRLDAGPINTKTVGFHAMDKGSLAHRMFEKIYDVLTSHSELKECGKSGYQNLARTAGQQILKKFNARRLQPIPDEWLQIELQRLTDLAGQWFEVETFYRADFKVIEKEQLKEIDIAGIPVRIRIDRVDQVGSDKIEVIDYKTGNCTLNDILGERPRDPQLMIYACSMDKIDDVAYAQIKRGDVGLKALSDFRVKDVTGYSRYGDLTQEVIDSWRETIFKLANEFLEGESEVSPLDSNVCSYCHLDSLCRIGDTSDQVSVQSSEQSHE